MKKWLILACAGALLGGSLSLAAQGPDKKPPRPEGDVFTWNMAATPGDGDGTFTFVSAEAGMQKLVKGAPYSAEAVTESIQTLPDGNRIVRKNSALLYRDNEGRTRREQTLGNIGGFAAQGEPPRFISIVDPVAGVVYSLNPRDRTAIKFTFNASRSEFIFSNGGFSGTRAARVEGGQKVGVASGGSQEVRVITRSSGDGPPPPPPPPPPGVMIDKQAVEMVFTQEGPPDAKGPKPERRKEDLGTQTIEGVSARGSRHVTTFPAGFFGNERPLEVVDEKWYSEELQTVVMTKHSDPRSGETTFRLTNINRSNPDRSLFEVPADYTVKEPKTMMRKPAPPAKPAAPPVPPQM
jgi:hypothetical protein